MNSERRAQVDPNADASTPSNSRTRTVTVTASATRTRSRSRSPAQSPVSLSPTASPSRSASRSHVAPIAIKGSNVGADGLTPESRTGLAVALTIGLALIGLATAYVLLRRKKARQRWGQRNAESAKRQEAVMRALDPSQQLDGCTSRLSGKRSDKQALMDQNPTQIKSDRMVPLEPRLALDIHQQSPEPTLGDNDSSFGASEELIDGFRPPKDVSFSHSCRRIPVIAVWRL
jgi:hypothetical protein